MILDVSFKATADITDEGLEWVARNAIADFVANYNGDSLITDEIVLLETSVQPEKENN